MNFFKNENEKWQWAKDDFVSDEYDSKAEARIAFLQSLKVTTEGY